MVSNADRRRNVEAALRAIGVRPSEAGARAGRAVSEVGLDEQADALVEELSGGQQQRLAVARALALRPRVFLADEPTAEQDPVFRDLVLSRLFAIADDGGILVLATHDPEVAARCTSQLHLRKEADLQPWNR